MGTGSTIAMQNVDGTVTAIQCNWDGYISHNGNILYQFYREDSKVRQLIRLGNLSQLQIEIGERHPFDSYGLTEDEKDPRWDSWCKAYGRDRGLPDQQAKSYSSWREYLAYNGDEYNYLFVPDEGWTVNTYSGNYKLADALKDDFVENA